MKRPVLVLMAALLLGGSGIVWWTALREDTEPLPDEKRVAMIELEDKQSGPGYFHPDDPAATPDEQGVTWIAPDKVAVQIDRVIRERKLDESSREKLAKLIEEVSEPHPSRVIGGNRVNLARLNVALDAMK
ncbi:potassium-transporting ATPase subunit C [Luteolibacter arcticus]|uniref:Potassium-transporting ATPase subunit C n=1 Tax=Luteolibacter arcticus TaxID=1581411 RepID=A0ABT3GL23_9BACT|nr:potassium-transporting ATPase subunit C [Luteolibacter arcticus]MCW1924207.1 potassium-transporting ATPase subunit C [Luteolibacter arcticus]